jgi:hypothetical protein
MSGVLSNVSSLTIFNCLFDRQLENVDVQRLAQAVCTVESLVFQSASHYQTRIEQKITALTLDSTRDPSG